MVHGSFNQIFHSDLYSMIAERSERSSELTYPSARFILLDGANTYIAPAEAASLWGKTLPQIMGGRRLQKTERDRLAERDAKTLSSVIARLGVADVRAFGLAWEDCEELLRKLGFSTRVEVVAA
jgi:hypothetical protein